MAHDTPIPTTPSRDSKPRPIEQAEFVRLCPCCCSEEKKLALLDHELCHAAPVLEPNGNQRLNELGERVWRIRRHDIEEFREVVKRHGCYKADLERFAEALESNRAEPLLAAADPRPEATQ